MITIYLDTWLLITADSLPAVKYSAKAIRCTVRAINPQDGQIYEKYAGWISSTMALHAGKYTPNYIYEAACKRILENKEKIREALVEAGKYMSDTDKAGTGVTNSIAHPESHKEINAVRKIMQANAPDGTKH